MRFDFITYSNICFIKFRNYTAYQTSGFITNDIQIDCKHGWRYKGDLFGSTIVTEVRIVQDDNT